MKHPALLSDQIEECSREGGGQPIKYEILVWDTVKFCIGVGALNFQKRIQNASWYSKK